MPDTTLVNAPDAITALRENLAEQFRELMERADKLLEAEIRVPAEVPDDETAGKVTDFIKQITAATKTAETHRVGAKQPHIDSGKAVDGFFKGISDPLEALKGRLNARLTKYLRAKEEKERQRRLEAERAAAAEAERLRQEALAAEAAVQTPAQLDTAIVKDNSAQKAEADLAKASKDAGAKAADLSRTRGDLGAVSSLKTFWDFRNLDYDKIELEKLRHHLPRASVEQAVRSFIRAGNKAGSINGVDIFENTRAAVA
ncbi:MAG: hypothetical protein ACREQ5_17670 [Candidatus Dormibacteria bacterium]